ncbi:DAK2 domain-containing protein [Spiroplasma endosymbiont of Crioceris asparagi]|uniref:DAK2 domain-containing protein n=1 Tax=Spiroplasma endosymbiont of Crioceris asparagi TaxID=3066286 RepID=UPI0030D06D85
MSNVKFLKNAIESGVNNIYNFHPQIDKLNVFPIPDGDTGTNMNLTCTSGFAEISKITSFENSGALMQKFSRGLIMSARGNSGVIFSQIIKGFATQFEGKDIITVAEWVAGFEKAKTIAYEAVMKPVEGTILTVIRETSAALSEAFKKNPSMTMNEFWALVVKEANVSLDNTPNLLEILKKVGVVDSGGFGLVKFFEGIEKFVRTKKIIAKSKKLETNLGENVNMDLEDEEFGYCTEAIVMLSSQYIKNINVKEIRSKFESFGNTSIVVVSDNDILKVHTHALKPGQILDTLQEYGDFQTIKVENMTLQSDKHVKGGNPNVKKGVVIDKTMTIIDSQIEEPKRLLNKSAIIAVVPSKKIQDYFKEELGVDFVINGGPKMNPSTNHFLKAISEVDAKDVYILPNDSNIIMSANQAKELEKKSRVHVLPTKTLVAGMTAILNIDHDESAKKNISNVTKSLKNLVSISLSKSTRNVKIDGVNIKENDCLAMVNGKVYASHKDTKEIIKKCLKDHIKPKTEIITIFKGMDATYKDVNFLRKFLDENYDVEYEIVDGDQEIYPFLISIE